MIDICKGCKHYVEDKSVDFGECLNEELEESVIDGVFMGDVRECPGFEPLYKN